jgi:hypothetical protein
VRDVRNARWNPDAKSTIIDERETRSISDARHQATAPGLLTRLPLQGHTCPRGLFDSRIQLQAEVNEVI